VADAVVIGSRIVQAIGDAPSDAPKVAESVLREFRDALDYSEAPA
jgi:tryptophan synthase alpha subunit